MYKNLDEQINDLFINIYEAEEIFENEIHGDVYSFIKNEFYPKLNDEYKKKFNRLYIIDLAIKLTEDKYIYVVDLKEDFNINHINIGVIYVNSIDKYILPLDLNKKDWSSSEPISYIF